MSEMQQTIYFLVKKTQQISHFTKYSLWNCNIQNARRQPNENVPTAITDQHKLFFTNYCTSNWSKARALHTKKFYRIRSVSIKTIEEKSEKNIYAAQIAAVIATRYINDTNTCKFEINKCYSLFRCLISLHVRQSLCICMQYA